MADKGTVGHYKTQDRHIIAPRERERVGNLAITGTAQLNEVSGPAVLWLFGARGMNFLCAIQAATNGSFTISNLAAGRYTVVIHGKQFYLPGVYVVDVS